MFSVDLIADFFILSPDEEAGDLLTHLKLQKLLYYAQGWHLASHGKPLFDEDLVAWDHGPVCQSIFQRFRGRGWDPIQRTEVTPEEFPEEMPQDFLEEIWQKYGKYSAKYLENLTHSEAPWIEAYGDGRKMSPVISKKAMREFFEGQNRRRA